jgi:hypothetical protein
MAICAFVIGWLIPFSYLLGRLTGRPPEGHRVLITISSLSIIAIFLERLVLVLPSTIRSGAAYGASDIVLGLLMTLGFGALFVLSFRIFVPRFGLTSRVEA